MGHFLKDRYSDLFPDDIYRRKDIYIRSTDRDRTLESAMANVGAFLNVKTPGYVPFPVHTLPTEMDNLLRYPNENCKRYSQIKQEISDTPKMRELNQIYHEDIVRMAELVNASTSMTIQNMWPVIDSIDCHIYNNKTGKILTNMLDDPPLYLALKPFPVAIFRFDPIRFSNRRKISDSITSSGCFWYDESFYRHGKSSKNRSFATSRRRSFRRYFKPVRF